jgi:hypothetical protein
VLRDYRPTDAVALNEVALSAFLQFETFYSDWKAMTSRVVRMSELSSTAEIIVAEDAGRIVGGVAYVGMDKPKPPIFDPGWPVIHMLVVAPAARGKGPRSSIDRDVCTSSAPGWSFTHSSAHLADYGSSFGDVLTIGLRSPPASSAHLWSTLLDLYQEPCVGRTVVDFRRSLAFDFSMDPIAFSCLA